VVQLAEVERGPSGMAVLETRSSDASKARRRRIAAVALAVCTAGCGIWRPPPDVLAALQPERLTAPAPERSWTPSQPSAELRAPVDAWRIGAPALPDSDTRSDLSALLDIALHNNPETRAAWDAARAAADRYGRALAPYYPEVRTEVGVSPNSRFLRETDAGTVTIRQNAYEPRLTLTYTLLDFGRRGQSAELARQRLLAANFAFNRRLQDVLFAVERAYYLLDAAQGLERAAERNVDLARTVRAAADQRLAVGLATRPEVLLARQVETRAVYDLENAHVGVKNAEADLALTLGMPANHRLAIESLEQQPLPAELGDAVDRLIDTALAVRPDLAARVAELRAADAALARAKADLLPSVGFHGHYGESIWDYTYGGSPRFHSAEPHYATVFSLDWDIFRGFDRLNAIREAEANAAAARAALASSELDAIAEVWRAYYDYRAAARKLDFADALLAASQEAYAATLKTYEAGLSDIVELLTAERDLAGARYTLVSSRAELLTTAARVAYAAGDMPLGALR
jgi:outer membrane protein